MATYNGEKYILKQLHSILDQIADDDEVIVSDDDSTDRTVELINNLNDKRIKVIRGGFHHFKWNFENALKHAGGDYIFLSDQDDVWLPGKYDRCMQHLQQVDLVCTDSTVVDADLNTLIPSFFEYYNSGRGILKNALKNTYFGACLAFNRKVLQAALPFPRTIEIGHDIWLGLVAECIGKTEFIDTPYLLYRRHDTALTNISNDLASRSKRPTWVKIMSRITVLCTITVFRIRHTIKKH